MTAAYEFDRPEVEGEDLTPQQAAAVRLKVDNLLLSAENRKLREGVETGPVAAVPDQPAPSVETYPRVDPDTGRTIYGSWNDLADPFVDKFHPRNNPNDAAYQVAIKDRAKEQIRQANQVALNADPIVLEHPGLGPLRQSQVEFYEQLERSRQAAYEAVLADPIHDQDGNEILDRKANPGEGLNDPTSAEYALESKRLKGARWGALYDSIPADDPLRMEKVKAGMFKFGYEDYAPTRQDEVREEIREANARALGSTTDRQAERERLNREFDIAKASRNLLGMQAAARALDEL